MRKILFLSLTLLALGSCAQGLKKHGYELYRHMDTTGPEKYSYKNAKGVVIIPDDRYPIAYTDTIKTIGFVVKRGEGIWAINTKGEELFRVVNYDNGPDYVSNGLFRIENEKGLIGFADMDGNVVIPPKFKWVDPFHEELSAVCIDCESEKHENPKIFTKLLKGAFGFIDKKGNIVIEPQFDLVSYFKNGRCKVWKNGREYYIDKKGNEIK
ncbi:MULTISPECIES: WG repeat-containing protein [Sphingobacterium]|uniref:WG repeat-containing protein n=1 Tax=Sphingobacterium TaxID=28453 RepID=UPI0013DCC33D|nr:MULTISPECIES: WG repeat-containing protein [unclassified Sphingobacterium]